MQRNLGKEIGFIFVAEGLGSPVVETITVLINLEIDCAGVNIKKQLYKCKYRTLPKVNQF